jgi:LysM repeat protein
MNRMLSLIALCLLTTLALTAVGCNSNKPSSDLPTNPQVTDIAPVAPSYAPTPVASAQPVYASQQVTPVSVSSPAASASASGGTYTVQKGDTLYKIARERYGNASAWKKIAAANPGSETVIKPGQQLIMP